MASLLETKVSLTDKVKSIYTPLNISEESRISGFAFSKRLAKQTGLTMADISPAFCQGSQPFKFFQQASKLASDSDGGATVNDNWIKIRIADDHPNASSTANSILMFFGRDRQVELSVGGGGFAAGFTYTWDLNDIGDWLEDHVDSDLWDEISLDTESNDGMKIANIRIKHSSQTILDWDCNLWLDASRAERYNWIVLTAKILEKKLAAVNNTWIPQIHWAAREIGKTDGRKYGADPGEAWCSEFASWCLRKSLWHSPSGNIGSGPMEDYFEDANRMYTHDDLINEVYKLTAGDYIRFEWADGSHHSGIFMEYIDDPDNPTDDTTIRTIEGNSHATVRVTTRDFRDILSVGNCQ